MLLESSNFYVYLPLYYDNPCDSRHRPCGPYVHPRWGSSTFLLMLLDSWQEHDLLECARQGGCQVTPGKAPANSTARASLIEIREMEVADCDFQMASKSQIVTLNDDHKILRSQFVTSKRAKT